MGMADRADLMSARVRGPGQKRRQNLPRPGCGATDVGQADRVQGLGQAGPDLGCARFVVG